MKKTFRRSGLIAVLFIVSCSALKAQLNTAAAETFTAARFSDKKSEEQPRGLGLPETKLTFLWFLAYANGEKEGTDVSQFSVNRGYINITSRFNSYISTRITPDLTVDKEGDGEGDLEMRLKYCYIMFHLPSGAFFTKPTVEFGLVHTPWLDFEQKINDYRAQGSMFMDRNSLFNSADQGVTFLSLLGGEMDDTYKDSVNSKYPGRYGSFSIGLYNGGGYHALEKNTNKVFQGRLTVRPLPDIIPGLQLSYLAVRGDGNTAESPSWTVNTGMLSVEHQYYVLAAQYYRGHGNGKGSAVYSDGESRPQEGYSVFGEYKIPRTRWGFIGRYDFFDRDTRHDRHTSRRTIAGLVYRFAGANKALLDYDTVKDSLTGERDSMLKFTIEVRF